MKVILDAAEAEVPGLRELARRSLETEARHLGVPLDVSSVIARQATRIAQRDPKSVQRRYSLR